MSQNATGTTWARNTSRSDETTRRRAASTPGGEPSPTPDHGCPSPSTISRPPGLRSVGIDTDVHDDLLLALELRDLVRVRIELSRIGSTSKKASLLSPSRLTDFRWRTPLMAAAATGDIAIFQAVMDAFNNLFSSPDDCTGGRMRQNSRAAAMHTQLELSDVDGRTLLMHATKDMGVFLSVAEEILPRQARKILPKKDARGMTFLMHAASAVGNTSTVRLNSPRSSFSDQGDEHGQRATEGPMDPADAVNLPDLHDCQDEHDTYGEGATLLPADPWVPLMRSAIDFARKILWMPEYRMLLTTRDMWERSILEHSVASGREQVFEACFNALRKDIFDTEVDVMLEVAEDEESKSCATAMTAALKTKGGKRVLGLFTKKAKTLKRDVALRAEASTVASKIQSFIPGNLIIVRKFSKRSPTEHVYGH